MVLKCLSSEGTISTSERFPLYRRSAESAAVPRPPQDRRRHRGQEEDPRTDRRAEEENPEDENFLQIPDTLMQKGRRAVEIPVNKEMLKNQRVPGPPRKPKSPDFPFPREGNGDTISTPTERKTRDPLPAFPEDINGRMPCPTELLLPRSGRISPIGRNGSRNASASPHGQRRTRRNE